MLNFWRKRASEPVAAPSEWDVELKRLVIAVRGLQDELSQLQGHHLKLRKQFDGSKGGRPVTDDAPPVGDKAALRAHARARGFAIT